MVLSVALSSSLDSATEKEPLSKSQALEIVRALNTAELDILLKTKNYAPLDSVVKGLREKPAGLAEFVDNSSNSSSGKIRDYQVSIITSSDGKHYKLALTPLEDSPACAVAFFSDESGVIYLGTAIDCKN